jgi:hypothetical protein
MHVSQRYKRIQQTFKSEADLAHRKDRKHLLKWRTQSFGSAPSLTGWIKPIQRNASIFAIIIGIIEYKRRDLPHNLKSIGMSSFRKWIFCGTSLNRFNQGPDPATGGPQCTLQHAINWNKIPYSLSQEKHQSHIFSLYFTLIPYQFHLSIWSVISWAKIRLLTFSG